MCLAFTIFVMNLMCAAAKSSGEVNVTTLFWTLPLCTIFCQALCTGQSVMFEFAASELSICSLGVADNPFIFWYNVLMLCWCLFCLLNLSLRATRVSGVVVGAVVVVNFKLELIVAWVVMGGITPPGLQCSMQSSS